MFFEDFLSFLFTLRDISRVIMHTTTFYVFISIVNSKQDNYK